MANNNDNLHYDEGWQRGEFRGQVQDNMNMMPMMSTELFPLQDGRPNIRVPPPSQHLLLQSDHHQPVYLVGYNPPPVYPSQLLPKQRPTHPVQAQNGSFYTGPGQDFRVLGATYSSLPYPSQLTSDSHLAHMQTQQQQQHQHGSLQSNIMAAHEAAHESQYIHEEDNIRVAHSRPPFVDPEAGKYEVTGTSVIAPGSVADANGRTYQGYKEGKYFLPNDPAEQDRLDFQYMATQLLLNDRLAWAPLENPRRVLDIATGTGIWASDFAEEYPGSNVVGSDMTPIQPPPRVSNVSFVIEDAEEPWIHDEKFDYIHARYVFSCFDSPGNVIRSAYEFMNPGGWVEFQDVSPVMRSAKGPEAIQGNPLKKFLDYCVSGAASMGRNVSVSQHYKRWMEKAGFVDVHEEKLKLPLNEWHPDPNLKRVGLYHSRMMLDNIRGTAWKSLQGNNLSDAEIDQLVNEARPEYRNLEMQAYMDFFVVYGRKPHDSEIGVAR